MATVGTAQEILDADTETAGVINFKEGSYRVSPVPIPDGGRIIDKATNLYEIDMDVMRADYEKFTTEESDGLFSTGKPETLDTYIQYRLRKHILKRKGNAKPEIQAMAEVTGNEFKEIKPSPRFKARKIPYVRASDTTAIFNAEGEISVPIIASATEPAKFDPATQSFAVNMGRLKLLYEAHLHKDKHPKFEDFYAAALSTAYKKATGDVREITGLGKNAIVKVKDVVSFQIKPTDKVTMFDKASETFIVNKEALHKEYSRLKNKEEFPSFNVYYTFSLMKAYAEANKMQSDTATLKKQMQNNGIRTDIKYTPTVDFMNLNDVRQVYHAFWMKTKDTIDPMDYTKVQEIVSAGTANDLYNKFLEYYPEQEKNTEAKKALAEAYSRIKFEADYNYIDIVMRSKMDAAMAKTGIIATVQASEYKTAYGKRLSTHGVTSHMSKLFGKYLISPNTLSDKELLANDLAPGFDNTLDETDLYELTKHLEDHGITTIIANKDKNPAFIAFPEHAEEGFGKPVNIRFGTENYLRKVYQEWLDTHSVQKGILGDAREANPLELKHRELQSILTRIWAFTKIYNTEKWADTGKKDYGIKFPKYLSILLHGQNGKAIRLPEQAMKNKVLVVKPEYFRRILAATAVKHNIAFKEWDFKDLTDGAIFRSNAIYTDMLLHAGQNIGAIKVSAVGSVEGHDQIFKVVAFKDILIVDKVTGKFTKLDVTDLINPDTNEPVGKAGFTDIATTNATKLPYLEDKDFYEAVIPNDQFAIIQKAKEFKSEGAQLVQRFSQLDPVFHHEFMEFFGMDKIITDWNEAVKKGMEFDGAFFRKYADRLRTADGFESLNRILTQHKGDLSHPIVVDAVKQAIFKDLNDKFMKMKSDHVVSLVYYPDIFNQLEYKNGIAEAFISEKAAKRLNLNKGDYFLDTRSPVAGQNEMVICQVKGIIPDNYGPIMILPHKLMQLLGRDYDINLGNIMPLQFKHVFTRDNLGLPEETVSQVFDYQKFPSDDKAALWLTQTFDMKLEDAVKLLNKTKGQRITRKLLIENTSIPKEEIDRVLVKHHRFVFAESDKAAAWLKESFNLPEDQISEIINRPKAGTSMKTDNADLWNHIIEKANTFEKYAIAIRDDNKNIRNFYDLTKEESLPNLPKDKSNQPNLPYVTQHIIDAMLANYQGKGFVDKIAYAQKLYNILWTMYGQKPIMVVFDYSYRKDKFGEILPAEEKSKKVYSIRLRKFDDPARVLESRWYLNSATDNPKELSLGAIEYFPEQLMLRMFEYKEQGASRYTHAEPGRNGLKVGITAFKSDHVAAIKSFMAKPYYLYEENKAINKEYTFFAKLASWFGAYQERSVPVDDTVPMQNALKLHEASLHNYLKGLRGNLFDHAAVQMMKRDLPVWKLKKPVPGLTDSKSETPSGVFDVQPHEEAFGEIQMKAHRAAYDKLFDSLNLEENRLAFWGFDNDPKAAHKNVKIEGTEQFYNEYVRKRKVMHKTYQSDPVRNAQIEIGKIIASQEEWATDTSYDEAANGFVINEKSMAKIQQLFDQYDTARGYTRLNLFLLGVNRYIKNDFMYYLEYNKVTKAWFEESKTGKDSMKFKPQMAFKDFEAFNKQFEGHLEYEKIKNYAEKKRSSVNDQTTSIESDLKPSTRAPDDYIRVLEFRKNAEGKDIRNKIYPSYHDLINRDFYFFFPQVLTDEQLKLYMDTYQESYNDLVSKLSKAEKERMLAKLAEDYKNLTFEQVDKITAEFAALPNFSEAG